MGAGDNMGGLVYGVGICLSYTVHSKATQTDKQNTGKQKGRAAQRKSPLLTYHRTK